MSPPREQPYRSQTTGSLAEEHIGQTLRLAGFLHRRRSLGSLLFFELRDAGALIQCVVEPDSPAFASLRSLSIESVISVVGTLVQRPAGKQNAGHASGALELRVSGVEILSEAGQLPFSVAATGEPPEELRLRHRFLDLRRERMRRNMLLRARLLARLRQLLQAQGFIEFQTPILTASSPEGARDFVVPSRLHPGKFYALPQAPQQFKQLLMVAGFERYFQIAPCFRDEDARRDRSPGEFYQLDVELAFVDQDQLFASIEPVLFSVFSELGRFSPSAPPFPRIAYQDALLRYGSDKPDLRNPLQLCDAGGWLAQQPMAAMVGAGAPARALRAPGAGPQSRRFFEEIAAELRDGGASFVSWARLADSGGAAEPVSPLTKAGADVAGLASLVAAAPGDAIFVLAAPAAGIDALGATLRQQVASRLGLIEADSYRFVWVVDFPMYERREDGTGWEFCHNPFSMPQGGLAALGGDPGSVLAYQFDIVVNGIELSSGAIRNHRPDVMLRAFEVAGYGPEEVERRFGGLLSAFRCGAPPHGGLAPGVDRMLMLLADEPNLREIIAFPLNQAGEDLLMGAPSELDPRQLAELQIRLTGE